MAAAAELSTYESQLRVALGLGVTDSDVAAAHTQPVDGRDEYGIPLSDEDAAHIRGVDSLRDASIAINQALAKASPGFVGSWVDNVTLTLHVMDSNPSIARAALTAMPQQASVVFHTGAIGPGAIASALDTLVQLREKDPNGAGLYSWSVDVLADKVDVDVLGEYPTMIDSIPAVQVNRLDAAPKSYYADRVTPYPHVRGGMGLVDPNVNHTGYSSYCTATLSAVGAGPTYYELTAGHCGKAGDYWNEGCVAGTGPANCPSVWTTVNTAPPVSINQDRGGSFVSGSTCDCRYIGPLPVSKATNWIYKTDPDSYAVSSIGQRSTLSAGTVLCWSGVTSGFQGRSWTDGYPGIVCGGVASNDATTPTQPGPPWDPSNKYFVHQISLNQTLSEGDSGGPLFSGSTNTVLWGVASQTSGSVSYFSSAGNIQPNLNVTPLTYAVS